MKLVCVSTLNVGDRFLLGGRTYEVVSTGRWGAMIVKGEDGVRHEFHKRVMVEVMEA